MVNEKDVNALIRKLEKVLRGKMAPVFKRYDADLEGMLSPLKWKPLVLVIGNYSSGKSTFINELLERQVQRTGQAPTDDSFTILTMPAEGEDETEIPGSTVVSDERLPFASLRRFGESLHAHLIMKKIDAPILKDLAIIDTPGMLDSVTEKDRGYDYLGVVSEVARLADLIILMFDPHKAGTIKETYQAIRSTLPGATGEDRVIYVMNRIDECENAQDLVRSYGTLCWNLSQMTGRKDIPRIYLTFAPGESEAVHHRIEPWLSERGELKQAVTRAPGMRFNHILQEVDRGIREVALVAEAMAGFQKGFSRRLRPTWRFGAVAALVLFLFGDQLFNLATGFPDGTFLGSLFSGNLQVIHILLPAALAILALSLTGITTVKLQFPRHVRRTLEDPESLVILDTAYKKDLWRRVRGRVEKRLREEPRKQLRMVHAAHQRKLEQFLSRQLSKYFAR